MGVTVLAVLLLILCLTILVRSAQEMARYPDQVFTGPSVIALLVRFFLPAAWFGGTAAGLLRGRAWARSCYFALCVLALVVTAGVLSSGMKGREAWLAAGGLVSVCLCMGAGFWYLLGSGVKAWFR
jgi:hypothetical protein